MHGSKWIEKGTTKSANTTRLSLKLFLFLVVFTMHICYVENKWEILPEFFLETKQYEFTNRGGRDEAWTKSLF